MSFLVSVVPVVAMVMAMGRNILPSMPSSASSGKYTSMMMATEKATGRTTALATSA